MLISFKCGQIGILKCFDLFEFNTRPIFLCLQTGAIRGLHDNDMDHKMLISVVIYMGRGLGSTILPKTKKEKVWTPPPPSSKSF